MALTAEQIQAQLEDYDFDALYEEIQSNITDKYTKGEGDDYPRSSNLNFVSYGNISLEDWQEQNAVTDSNNNTSLSNDQLTQLKTFSAMQPKYDPIKVSVGMGSTAGVTGPSEADKIRSANLRKTPGPIYTDFNAYSQALRDHNKKIKTYIEDNKIPTSVTTPDGVKLELNVGLTPTYYQEQRDGGRLQNVLHMNTDQGYYTQLGGIGQYGSYHRPKISESKSFFEGFKDVAPYFAAFVGVAVLGPMIGKYVASQGGILAAVKNAPATFKAVAGSINQYITNTLVSAGIPEAVAGSIDIAGSLAGTLKGVSYAEQYLDQESSDAIDAALASATGANGLPGGVVYSGPGAGPEGEINAGVIYNITSGTTGGTDAADEEAEDEDALDINAVLDAYDDATSDKDETAQEGLTKDTTVDPVSTAITDAANEGGDADAIVTAAGDAASSGVATVDENEDVIAATQTTTDAEKAVKVSTQSYSDYLAGIGMEDLDRTIAVNEAQLRRIPRLYRKTRGKIYQRRIDQAKATKRNRLVKAKQIADAAKVDFENAKKAEALARKEAEDQYKKDVVKARKDAEEKVKKAIDAARTAAKTAAEEREKQKNEGISEAKDSYSDVVSDAGELGYDTEFTQEDVQAAKDTADQIVADEAAAAAAETEAPDYTKVEGTPGGLEDLPADEQEVTSEVEPFEEPEDPPLDVKEPVVEEPEETETAETAETDESKTGGGGGGGAGEGAGAGQGGDTGADAETGTTTAAETGEAGAADVSASAEALPPEQMPYTGDNSYMPADQVIARQLYEIYLQETDPELKAAMLKEYQKYAETTLPPDEAYGVWTVADNEAAKAAAEAAAEAAEASQYASGMEVATGENANTKGQWVQLVNGAWQNTVTGKIAGTTSTAAASGEGEWEVLNPDGTGTGEVIQEFSDDTGADQTDAVNVGLPTDEEEKQTEAAGTAGTGEEVGTTTTTDTGTTTTTTTTDTTTTADTSTGTAGATTTTTETTTGGAGTGTDLGTSDTAADTDQAGAGADGTGTGTTGPTDETGAGDADATGTGTGAADATGSGTGASGTPGAGAGDEGDPGDVGEGTGTGAGTGTGTGGGTGSGEGTGTGSGTGEGTGDGTGEGTGRGFDFGSQQLLQALQPQQVQVKAAPVADIGTPYTFESIFADPKQEAKFISPYGPRKRAAGGVINADPDSILRLLGERPKPANDINELLRIIGGK